MNFVSESYYKTFDLQDQKSKGVIAASAGNHALALCYHGKELGIPVTVVMPKIAPIMKVQTCRVYGANVIVAGNDISEVYYFFHLESLHYFSFFLFCQAVLDIRMGVIFAIFAISWQSVNEHPRNNANLYFVSSQCLIT